MSNISFRKRKPKISKRHFNIVIVSLLWLVTAFIVNPIGEFPLNDDWAYSKNVYHLTENGQFDFSDWPAMTLIAQTLWGAIFCKIFGFSFTVLRLSVLVLSLTGIIGFYLLVKQLSNNDKLAFFSALLLAFNPLYFSLSYTFMTDVPFLVALIWSFYFYSIFFYESRLKYFLLATLLAFIATMIRQLGVWVVVAYVLVYIFSKKINIKHLLFSLLMLFFVVFSLILYAEILKHYNKVPEHYSSISDLLKNLTFRTIQENMSYRCGIILFHLGLFLLPLSVYILPTSWKETNISFRWILGSASIILAIPVILTRPPILIGNILYNGGLGPKVFNWGINQYQVLTNEMMITFRIVGLVSATVLIFIVLSGFLKLKSNLSNSFSEKTKLKSIIVVIGFLGFLIINTSFFDRYFLILLPFLIIFIVPLKLKNRTMSFVFSIIILFLYSFFSIAATHDYLSWNRARWKGLNELIAKGVTQKKIDGGFEFNGWFETGKWERTSSDEYVVAFSNLCEYKNYKSYRYNSFLTFRKDSVIIHQKQNMKYDTIKTILCNAETLCADSSYFLSSDGEYLFEKPETRYNKEAHSGDWSILLDKEKSFGFTFKLKGIIPCEKLLFSVWTKYNKGQASLVVAAPDISYIYTLSTINEISSEGWQTIQTEILIPYNYPFNTINVYLWNQSGEKVLFDDLIIKRLTAKP